MQMRGFRVCMAQRGMNIESSSFPQRSIIIVIIPLVEQNLVREGRRRVKTCRSLSA